MPSRPQRITNGHRAAVCGLVIAGLPIIESCKIAGAPWLLMRKLLPEGWHKRSRRPGRWAGHELEGLHEAWMDPAQRTSTIAARYGVTTRAICIVGRKNGWAPRKPPGRANVEGVISFRAMQPQQRATYLRLRRTRTRAEALQGALA